MTDYERHARLLAGPKSDLYEVASVLGAHGFRVCPLLVGRARGVAVLIDAVTHEPIANVTGAEARELAAWLELERPLPARLDPTYLRTQGWTAAEFAAVYGPDGIGRGARRVVYTPEERS